MEQFYKIIDDKMVFFKNPLTVGTTQVINPSKEMLLEQGWNEYVTPEPTASQILINAKKEKLKQIDDYDQSVAVNSFIINGKEMWLDSVLRQQLRISVQAYQSLGIENVTKWFDGIEYTFTTTEWLYMLDLLEVYAAEALNVTESHKSQIEALTDIEDIENYDITIGYPNKISF